MFIPSQSTFPISPVKYTDPFYYQNLKNCKKCNQSCYSFDAIMQEKFANDSLKIDKNKIIYICSGCRRTRGFNYNIVRDLIGSSKTKDDWKELKDKLYAKYPKHISLHLYKFLRSEYYYARTTVYWENQLSKYEVDWLYDHINELSKNESCVDNIRVAVKGKSKQVKRYWKQANKGCCGSRDTEIFNLLTGKTYLIGFNYGH